MGKDIFIEFFKTVKLKQVLAFISTLLFVSIIPLIILQYFITLSIVIYFIGFLLNLYFLIDEFDNEESMTIMTIVLFCFLSWIGFFVLIIDGDYL
jgi:hypothetical protein